MGKISDILPCFSTFLSSGNTLIRDADGVFEKLQYVMRSPAQTRKKLLSSRRTIISEFALCVLTCGVEPSQNLNRVEPAVFRLGDLFNVLDLTKKIYFLAT